MQQCNTTEHHFIGEASLLFAFLNQLDLILLRPDLLKAPSRTSAFPSFLKKIPWKPKFRNIHEKHPIEKHSKKFPMLQYLHQVTSTLMSMSSFGREQFLILGRSCIQ